MYKKWKASYFGWTKGPRYSKEVKLCRVNKTHITEQHFRTIQYEQMTGYFSFRLSVPQAFARLVELSIHKALAKDKKVLD